MSRRSYYQYSVCTFFKAPLPTRTPDQTTIKKLSSMPNSTSTMAVDATSGATPPPPPPPPTPSFQSQAGESSTSSSSSAISTFLNNLFLNPSPPSLSLPSRPSSPPLISLLSPQLHLLLSASTNLGLFHLTDHSIPSHLPSSAALQSSPFLFSSTTPTDLGFSADETEADMVFDVLSDKITAMPALAELGGALGKIGLSVVKLLATAGGFPVDPFGTGQAHARCLVWVQAANGGTRNEEMLRARKRYPYVVGLEYEMREKKGPWWVLGDSGEWSSFAARADSVLVSLGDIAQVWSNGRFKKVRAIHRQISPISDGHDYTDSSISISLLVTLNMDSVVAPLTLRSELDGCDEEADESGAGGEKYKRKFQSFAFEEYAWRVYNDRFPFKDPLLKYRI